MLSYGFYVVADTLSDAANTGVHANRDVGGVAFQSRVSDRTPGSKFTTAWKLRPSQGTQVTPLPSVTLEVVGQSGRLFRHGHQPPGSQQQLDGIGQVFFRDVMIAPFDAE